MILIICFNLEKTIMYRMYSDTHTDTYAWCWGCLMFVFFSFADRSLKALSADYTNIYKKCLFYSSKIKVAFVSVEGWTPRLEGELRGLSTVFRSCLCKHSCRDFKVVEEAAFQTLQKCVILIVWELIINRKHVISSWIVANCCHLLLNALHLVYK